MASVGELVARLTNILTEVEGAREKASAARAKLYNSSGLFLRVNSERLTGAVNPSLLTAVEHLEMTVRCLATADEAVRAYIVGIGGNLSGPAAPAPALRDSRGQAVPPGVSRLPSGRLPQNFGYAGRVFDGPTWTDRLRQKYPTGVRFTDDGFPDFAPYAVRRVVFVDGFGGNRATDFEDANHVSGFARTPDGYTWHHHQDTRTMLLVPADLHLAVRHAGGVAIVKGRGLTP